MPALSAGFQSLPYPGDQESYLDVRDAMPIFEAWNGVSSVPGFLTGISDPTNYAWNLKNAGSGGKALNILSSVGLDLFDVTDTGTNLTNLHGSGQAEIDGDTLLNSILEVIGAGTFNSTLGVLGAGTFESTLHGMGAATFDDLLDVGGDGTFAANVDIVGDLTVGGDTVLDGTLDVGGTLDVTGATTLTTVTAGASTLASLTVTGAFQADGAVTLGNATSDVVTITGTLPAGSAADPSLAIGTATDGLYQVASGQLQVTNAGVHSATFKAAVQTSTAGLGINQLAPLRALHVVGPLGVAPMTPAANTVAVFENNGNGNVEIVGPTTAQQRFAFSDTTAAVGGMLYLHATDELQFQAGAAVNLRMTGTGLGFYGTAPATKPTVSGSRGGNAALADLLTELATLGLITDSSSA